MFMLLGLLSLEFCPFWCPLRIIPYLIQYKRIHCGGPPCSHNHTPDLVLKSSRDPALSPFFLYSSEVEIQPNNNNNNKVLMLVRT